MPALVYDPTGKLPANLVIGEVHSSITEPDIYPTSGMFYLNGLSVSGVPNSNLSTTVNLRPKIDYLFSPKFKSFSEISGVDIYSYILLINYAVWHSVTISYQAVGGGITDVTLDLKITTAIANGNFTRANLSSWLAMDTSSSIVTSGNSGGGGSSVVTANLGTLNGAATDSSVQQVVSAIKASVNIANLLWTDPTVVPNVYYVRRESVNEGTGVLTVSWENPNGTSATPSSVSNLRPVANTANIQSQSTIFTATSIGTGYLTGDVLIHNFGVNTSGSTPYLAYSFWLNAGPSILTNTILSSAPTTGTYTPIVQPTTMVATTPTGFSTYSITNGGTAQNLFTAIATGAYFEIGNPDNAIEPIYLNIYGTATFSSCRINPGGYYQSPMKVNIAPSILAETTGHVFYGGLWT